MSKNKGKDKGKGSIKRRSVSKAETARALALRSMGGGAMWAKLPGGAGFVENVQIRSGPDLAVWDDGTGKKTPLGEWRSYKAGARVAAKKIGWKSKQAKIVQAAAWALATAAATGIAAMTPGLQPLIPLILAGGVAQTAKAGQLPPEAVAVLNAAASEVSTLVGGEGFDGEMDLDDSGEDDSTEPPGHKLDMLYNGKVSVRWLVQEAEKLAPGNPDAQIKIAQATMTELRASGLDFIDDTAASSGTRGKRGSVDDDDEKGAGPSAVEWFRAGLDVVHGMVEKAGEDDDDDEDDEDEDDDDDDGETP